MLGKAYWQEQDNSLEHVFPFIPTQVNISGPSTSFLHSDPVRDIPGIHDDWSLPVSLVSGVFPCMTVFAGGGGDLVYCNVLKLLSLLLSFF